MRRLALVLTVGLVALWIVPAGASAALYVSSQRNSPTAGVTGLVDLSDGGGETLRNGAGGSAIAGTGGGPIVYNSGGGGSVKQLSGNSYRTLATGVGGGISSMTVTGRGLVVANANKLQYLSGGHLTDVPHGTISNGPWVSITTQPNGLLLGWAWNNGWGSLYELNLGSGATTQRDFTGQTNDPLFNNRDNGFLYAGGPVANSGGISADAQGGIWLAGAGDINHFGNAQVYYASPGGGSFNSVDSGYNRPRISATGDGKAYASSTFTAPNEGHVYKLTPAGVQGEITSAAGRLKDSLIEALAVDRCYTFCSVSPPPIVGIKQTFSAPKKTIKLGKKGLKLKLKCSVACSVTISGKLVFGKAKKKKSSAAALTTLKKTKAKLKAGKSKTVTIKLSKKQRKAVKKALKKKRKVYAKLKIVVKAQGVKTVTKRPKLRIK